MKQIIFVLAILPILATAQKKPSAKTTLPLIESITSDTINGKYKAVVFEYDQLKRVSSITDKIIEIKKGSKNETGSVETLMKVQKFKYLENEQIPFARNIINYQYDDTTMVTVEELQFFLFKNGQRIGDSTIYPAIEQQVANAKSDDKNSPKRVAYFLQTPTKIIHVLDLSVKHPETYIPANVYADSIVLKKEHNIGFESTEHDDGDKFYPRAYFTFSKFDQGLNPFHQINIAPLLSNEKITFSFSSDDMKQIGKCFDGLGTEFNWHFLNQNNPVNYFFERGETESPFKDYISLAYAYDQNQLPIYCKAHIKKVFKAADDRRLAGTYIKCFTFKYHK